MATASNRFTKANNSLFLASLGAIQNALVGGVIYGWASIDNTLLAAPRSRGGADLSLKDTTDIFSWANSVGMVSSLLLGVILDKYGPRACSVVSHLFIAGGSFLFCVAPSFGIEECFRTAATATCLISFGGPGIQLSLVHLANLFPDAKYFTMTCLNGMISISFIMFVLFDFVWTASDGRIGVSELFGCFGIVATLSLVASCLYWPDSPFEVEETTRIDNALHLDDMPEHVHLFEQGLDSGLREGNPKKLELHESFIISKKAQQSGNEALISLKDRPFWQQLFSPTNLRTVLLFVVTCFVANFYVASISTEMADCSFLSVEDQHRLGRIFTSIISFGFLPSLILGRLLDTLGIDACNAINLACGQTQMLILVFSGGSFSMKILSFIPYVFLRQFLFQCYIASHMGRLGFKYFGLLNGIGFAISGLTQVFMSSLVGWIQSWCDDNADLDCKRQSWITTHWWEFAIFTILLLVPILDYRDDLIRKRMIREAFGSRRTFSLSQSLSSINENRPLKDALDGLDDYLSIGSGEDTR